VTISAVGDVMLGDTPELPSDPAAYFDSVKAELSNGANIVFGNLEGALTSGGVSKCGKKSSSCYAFRAPPAFANALAEVGFTVLNDANNHAFDYGAPGVASTVAALKGAGIQQAGLPGEITIVHLKQARVAFVDFAPYSNVNDLLNIPAARALVAQARAESDFVVVYMHAGAEGLGAEHVTGHEEFYVGEDRGNPEAFAKAMIESGADAVIASGPHVLRGIQFDDGHLIAYSLGNFAGYHNFALTGALSTSAILRMTFSDTGQITAARIVPVQLVGAGQPVLGGSAISLIQQLSKSDFGPTAATICASGTIVIPGAKHQSCTA
jgi:poly-gamma-glutamate capsule biosynthesis protein CapA/YwtB (metallophosphatase superfamily)